MIDSRFSVEGFERARLETENASGLSRELAEVIQEELDAVLRPAFLKIIEQLNSLGHKLQLSGEALAGDICFLEPRRDGQRGYQFLVGIDVIVTTDYL
jgi:hypothetical protein